jgi:predicted amidohydrolase
LGDEIPRYALTQSNSYFEELLSLSKLMPLIVGYIERSPRGRIFNAAALLDEGRPVHIHRKVYLPNYGVWDEQKRFARGRRLEVFPFRGFRFAMFICNDFWYPSMPYLAASNDADVFVVISNSALDTEGMNPRAWDMLLRSPALLYGGYVVFANRVGSEHGWSFWGGSTVIAPFGLSIIAAESGEELLHACLDHETVEQARDALPLLRDMDIDFTLRELNNISQQHLLEND